MERQLDDAVTAFRSGRVMAEVGHNEDEVFRYRVVYICAMALKIAPFKGAAAERMPIEQMALEDAEADREELRRRRFEEKMGTD